MSAHCPACEIATSPSRVRPARERGVMGAGGSIRETCSCGATFAYQGAYAEERTDHWRENHRHEAPSAPLSLAAVSEVARRHSDRAGSPEAAPDFCRGLRATSPSPGVLAVIEQIEAEHGLTTPDPDGAAAPGEGRVGA